MSLSPDPVRLSEGTDHSQILSGNALGMASMIAWACGFPAAELLLKDWTPLGLITVRFLMAVLLLVPVWALLDGPGSVLKARWGKGALVGGLSFGLGAWSMLMAQALTDAVTVAIIAAACPIAATLLEVALGRRRLRLNFVVGLGASVLGGIITTGAGGFSGDIGMGATLAILSCFLFAWGSHAAVEDFPDLSPTGRSAITLAGGLFFTLILTVGGETLGYSILPQHRIDGGQVTWLAIYALGGMALSQVMWIMSVGRLGVAVASFHINVAPFYVMLLMLALGSAWSWPQAAGAAIVIAGVVISQRRPRLGLADQAGARASSL